jgi:anti-sigma factor RsiW
MSKECQRLAADLSAYSDEELDRNAANLLEAHLGQCPDCRKELARTGKLKTLLRATAKNGASENEILRKLLTRVSELTSGGPGQSGAAAKGRRMAPN